MKQLIFLVVLLVSCTHNDYLKRNYESNKSLLNHNLTSHMPLTTSNFTILIQSNISSILKDSVSKGFNPLELFIVEKYDEHTFDVKLNNVNLNKQNCHYANDTNLILIGQYLLHKYGYFKFVGFEEGDESKEIISRNFRNKNNFPVPVFDITGYKKSSYVGLSEEFQICVIEAKQGIYASSDVLSKDNLMPDNWKHGFSKGYAISEKEKTIIYWCMVW